MLGIVLRCCCGGRQVLRSLVVEVLLDKPSEKTLFQVWREGQQRADAAAGDSASFRMEEDQVSKPPCIDKRSLKPRHIPSGQ